MPQSFRLPLPSANPEQIHFPDYCICCGAPRQADSTLVVNRLVMRGQRQESVTLRYAVPRCDTCNRRTKAVFLAGLLPFLAGFILLGGAAFVLTAFYASELGIDRNSVPGSATLSLWEQTRDWGLAIFNPLPHFPQPPKSYMMYSVFC